MDNYHLLYDGDRWTLTAEGSDISLGEYERKTDAVTAARETVSELGGSLKIHGTDGQIEEERTYPRSADPQKSPG